MKKIRKKNYHKNEEKISLCAKLRNRKGKNGPNKFYHIFKMHAVFNV